LITASNYQLYTFLNSTTFL